MKYGNLQDNNYIVATIRRDYNTDDSTRLQWKNLPMRVVMPLHPRTCKRIQEFGYTLEYMVLEIQRNK